MKIKLQSTTDDLNHLAGIIEGRTDRAGMVKVSRDSLARVICDHAKILANICADSLIDVADPDPAGPPAEDPEVADDDGPALLRVMEAPA